MRRDEKKIQEGKTCVFHSLLSCILDIMCRSGLAGLDFISDLRAVAEFLSNVAQLLRALLLLFTVVFVLMSMGN